MNTFPSESRVFQDPRTGARVRQITSHPSIHHHPFYYVPAFDDAMRHLFFVSHRTGRAEIWAEERATGTLRQLTSHPGLAEWSIHPSHDGRTVYFTDEGGAWRVETESGREELLVHFGGALREAGMVGAAMGTTTLSRDDRFWAVPIKVGTMSRFVVIETATGKHQTILERDTIGHPEFHPDDNTLLRYAGPYHSRIWTVNRDGSDNRLVYQREDREWIVHETWRPGTREIVTANWPHGCIGIDIDSGNTRPVCSFNAWHPAMNRAGTLMCADTTFPDNGLQLFDVRDGIGEPRALCETLSSNAGAHWNTDHCPYDDGPVDVYAPQHTHPHPGFSPDGKYVVFTSDRSGHAQLYEVEVSTVEFDRTLPHAASH